MHARKAKGARIWTVALLMVFVVAAARVWWQAAHGALVPAEFGVGGTVTIIAVGLALAAFSAIDLSIGGSSATHRARWTSAFTLCLTLYGVAHLAGVGITPALLGVCAVALAAQILSAVGEPAQPQGRNPHLLAFAFAPIAIVAPIQFWAAALDTNEVNAPRPPDLSSLEEGGRARLLKWYDRRRELQGVPPGPLVVTEYVDYTCPACRGQFLRTTLTDYYWRKRAPGRVTFKRVAFPLSRDCNPTVEAEIEQSLQSKHALACQSAVAVHLAEESGRRYELEDWLFAQDQSLTMPLLEEAASRLGGVSVKSWSRAPEIVASIANEAATAGAAGIVGTPTFVLNGVVVPRPGSEEFDAIIEHELFAASSPLGRERAEAR